MLRLGVVEGEDVAAQDWLVEPARYVFAEHTGFRTGDALAGDDQDHALAGGMGAGHEVVEVVVRLRLRAAMEIDAAFDRRLAALEAFGLSLVDADSDSVRKRVGTLRRGRDRCGCLWCWLRFLMGGFGSGLFSRRHGSRYRRLRLAAALQRFRGLGDHLPERPLFFADRAARHQS